MRENYPQRSPKPLDMHFRQIDARRGAAGHILKLADEKVLLRFQPSNPPMRKPAAIALLFISVACASIALAQVPANPAALTAAQRDAMAVFASMDGVRRGPVWTILTTGEKHHVTQTERIGPFLDGPVQVIEGRGYDSDGKVAFNAFGTISFNPAIHACTLNS